MSTLACSSVVRACIREALLTPGGGERSDTEVLVMQPRHLSLTFFKGNINLNTFTVKLARLHRDF